MALLMAKKGEYMLLKDVCRVTLQDKGYTTSARDIYESILTHEPFYGNYTCFLYHGPTEWDEEVYPYAVLVYNGYKQGNIDFFKAIELCVEHAHFHF